MDNSTLVSYPPNSPIDFGNHADVLYIGKLIDLVSETMTEGYGEVTFRVTVKGGKVTMVQVSKTVNHLVDSSPKTA